jgi:hypothetical protein
MIGIGRDADRADADRIATSPTSILYAVRADRRHGMKPAQRAMRRGA